MIVPGDDPAAGAETSALRPENNARRTRGGRFVPGYSGSSETSPPVCISACSRLPSMRPTPSRGGFSRARTSVIRSSSSHRSVSS